MINYGCLGTQCWDIYSSDASSVLWQDELQKAAEEQKRHEEKERLFKLEEDSFVHRWNVAQWRSVEAGLCLRMPTLQDALAANRERLEIELEGKNRVLEAERLEAHHGASWRTIEVAANIFFLGHFQLEFEWVWWCLMFAHCFGGRARAGGPSFRLVLTARWPPGLVTFIPADGRNERWAQAMPRLRTVPWAEGFASMGNPQARWMV